MGFDRFRFAATVKGGANRLKRAFRHHVLRDAGEIAMAQWYELGADETLRIEYALEPRSVVFDVGGYDGEWAARIHARYGCFVWIFEPVRAHYAALARRFEDNPRIEVLDFGLGGESGERCIYVAGEASSTLREAPQRELSRFVDIVEFVKGRDVPRIDLIKINIEGGEYELLARMIEAGLVERCSDIQVQFHRFVPNAVAMRHALRDRLAKTHQVTFDFPFVWENWRSRTPIG
jgi:FkbM family methyltransferase